jgi:DNA-binding IclR family transcriptional regulator
MRDLSGMPEVAAIERYRAPALDKGLDIIELLAATDEGMTLAEIAKALGRSSNEIYRMLDRLVRRSYVSRGDDRYALTLKLFALAHQHAPMRRLVSQATPLLRDFSRRAEQSSHLAIYGQGHVIVVAQFDSPSYWGLSIRVGSRIGLFNTGSGHVLLAFAAPGERDYMIAEHEVVPGERRPADLDDRLAVVRARGFEQMESQQTTGVFNLSVPVLGPNGGAIAAVSVPYMPRIDGLQAPDMAAVLAMMQEVARALSQTSGGIPEGEE